MKKISKLKQGILFFGVMFLGSTAVFAQAKVGANPTTIAPNSNLEVEATNNKKVIVNKSDGTFVIENTPDGADNDRYLSVDGAGNVRAVTPVTQGISVILRGAIVTPIHVTTTNNASLVTSGYITSASCTSTVYTTTISLNFPDLGTIDYDVFLANNLNQIGANPSYANDIRYPLVFEKTSNSFKVFLEEVAPNQIGSNFSFMIIK